MTEATLTERIEAMAEIILSQMSDNDRGFEQILTESGNEKMMASVVGDMLLTMKAVSDELIEAVMASLPNDEERRKMWAASHLTRQIVKEKLKYSIVLSKAEVKRKYG